MPCKIYLRQDQSVSQRSQYSSDCARIYAPLWVKQALEVLGQHLKGVTFEVFESSSILKPPNSCGNQSAPIESFTISEDFNNYSLKVLQKIARNESHNVTGVINTLLYPDIKDRRVLYSIRDLVRQCVIVGVDECSACGGYRCGREAQTKQKVFICDLAALQFQQPYNTGRLILIQKHEQHKGILDDLIYEKVVGEKKLTFDQISRALESNDQDYVAELKKRYLTHDGYGSPGQKSCFIDVKAYRKFVTLDVVLSGLAIHERVSAQKNEDKVNFKFLKYGTGFFAWKFSHDLDNRILSGVMDGLEELFRREPHITKTIRRVELPFYKSDPESKTRIEIFTKKYDVNILFGSNDALKQCQDGLYVATTNCGDNHTVCGNEMNYGSVDAAIAENLSSKGNILCPNINLLMTEQYIDIN